MKTPRFIAIVPGLALVATVAWLAHRAHGWIPPRAGRLVGEVILALGAGLVVGNVLRIPKFAQPGIRFAFQTLLRTAVVLLGATLTFTAAASIGRHALLVVVALMALALLTAYAAGRAFGLDGRLATLIGVGAAVCGTTAIGAVAPVIGARDEETSVAVAVNALLGTLAVFAYPALGHALGMTDPAFGTWAGAVVNDTSQAVAAGFAFSQAAGRITTVVKLTRTILMGGVVVVLGLLHAGGGQGQAGSLWLRLKHSMPPFILLFAAACLLNTLGVVSWASHHLGRDLPADAQTAARFLILVALAGVGLGTPFGALRRVGLRPLWVGLATALVTSAAGYAMIHVFGPAGGRS